VSIKSRWVLDTHIVELVILSFVFSFGWQRTTRETLCPSGKAICLMAETYPYIIDPKHGKGIPLNPLDGVLIPCYLINVKGSELSRGTLLLKEFIFQRLQSEQAFPVNSL
jgi:hypothetical protein